MRLKPPNNSFKMWDQLSVNTTFIYELIARKQYTVLVKYLFSLSLQTPKYMALKFSTIY